MMNVFWRNTSATALQAPRSVSTAGHFFAMLLGFGLCLESETAEANGSDIFVDTKTLQLYAEPAEGRIKFQDMRRENLAPTAEKPAVADNKDSKDSKDSKKNQVDIRGYMQFRYTEHLSGAKGIDLWTDRSVGDKTSDATDNFLIRRGRLVFSGDRGDYLHFYIQPDYASSAGTTNNVFQLRDAYMDVYLQKDKVHRIRAGQSKVPYGFENLQSSSNRLTLDRADALNSAVRDERDLGVFYYYTPKYVQDYFSEISKLGLKHSGNYGMFGFGVYNGQGANRRDVNDTLHSVIRATLPVKLSSGQFYEVGVQAYSGKYIPTFGAYNNPGFGSPAAAAGVGAQVANRNQDSVAKTGLKDERIGISAVWYPQPFGLQAEWNWGTTPALDLATNTVGEKSLNGGYVQAMFKHDFGKDSAIIPFAKWQYFDGANKAETNAPVNEVNDWEVGVEWQANRQVELTAVYHRMDRNDLVLGNRANLPDFANFKTNALRLQLQLNY